MQYYIYWFLLHTYIDRRKLEVKLPTIWTNEKQRWEESEKRREERSKERKCQKKADPGARKGRKVAKKCIFPLICCSGGSKSRLAKAAGAEVSGQMIDEKLHTVVARSTFRSQNAQNTPAPDHFWKLRCRRSARCCGTKHISKSKCTKHTSSGPLLEVATSKKCTPLWREAHFEVKSAKNWRVRSTFGRSDVVSRGRHTGLCTLSKVSKTWGFCSISKNDGRQGAFEDIWRRSAKMHFPWQAQYKRDVHQSCSEVRAVISSEGLHFGASDLQVCWDDFAWQVQHFVWPGITFSWQAQYLRQVESKKSQNLLVRGRQLCTQLSMFEGSLAELLRFWCCQPQKMRKSRRLVSFLMLSSAKIEEVSLNCCVFDVVKFNNSGSLAE